MTMILYSPEKFTWTLVLACILVLLTLADTYILFEGKRSRLNRLWLLFQGGLIGWCVTQFLAVVAPTEQIYILLNTIKLGFLILCVVFLLQLLGPWPFLNNPLSFSGAASEKYRIIAGIFYGSLTLLVLVYFFSGSDSRFLLDGLPMCFAAYSLGILALSYRYAHNDLMPVSVMPALASADSMIIIASPKGRILYHNRNTLPGSSLCIAGVPTLQSLSDLLREYNGDICLEALSLDSSPQEMELDDDSEKRYYDVLCKSVSSTRYRKGSLIIEIIDHSRQHHMIHSLRSLHEQLETINHRLRDYGTTIDTLAAEAELDRIETELSTVLGKSYELMEQRLEDFKEFFGDPNRPIAPETIDESLNGLIDEIRSVITALRVSIHRYSLKGEILHD